MLKIRLRRMGSRHRPFFRVVVSDSRRTPTAASVEEVGYYDPRQEPSIIAIDADRIAYWHERGAQISDAVKKLIKQSAKAPVVRPQPAVPEPAATEPAVPEPAAEATEAAEAGATAQAAEATASDESEKSDTSDAAQAAPAEAAPEEAAPEATEEEKPASA